MYTRFQATGPLDPQLGLIYRRTVLEPGGSLDATRLAGDFLGRGPDHRAFLHNLGLAPDPSLLIVQQDVLRDHPSEF